MASSHTITSNSPHTSTSDTQASGLRAPELPPRATHGGMHGTAGAAARAWGAAWMLTWREWTRFFRQRNRVIGALGQPIIFWLLFGTGMHAAFRVDSQQNFMDYYLPGTVTLILLFTAIFATISIIEDRREGFLQNVLVAPVPRWTIALGKMVGGAAIAWAQGLVFLGLALAVGSIAWTWALGPLLLLMAIAALAMTALGVFFAWPMESTQGFHAIMNLVLMPLWLLSGAFFPVPLLEPGAPVGQFVMHWVMRANPVTYIIAGMRQLLSPGLSVAEAPYWMPSLAACWGVSCLFLAITFAAAWWIVSRQPRGA
jgi:ABC-2 type transport system permease protein